MAIYKISHKAEIKLAEIYEYSLGDFGEEIADEYFMAMHEAFLLLAQQPSLGRKFYEYHRHDHHSHTIIYKTTEYGILILYIFHNKEDIENKV